MRRAAPEDRPTSPADSVQPPSDSGPRLVPDDPAQWEYEDYVRAGREAVSQLSRGSWSLGDLAAGLLTIHGEATLRRYAKDIGVDFGTLQSYRTVAVAYPEASRRLDISWSVHQVLAAQPDRLELISREDWTVAQARCEVRERAKCQQAQREQADREKAAAWAAQQAAADREQAQREKAQREQAAHDRADPQPWKSQPGKPRRSSTPKPDVIQAMDEIAAICSDLERIFDHVAEDIQTPYADQAKTVIGAVDEAVVRINFVRDRLAKGLKR